MGCHMVASTGTPFIHYNSSFGTPWEHPLIDHNVGPDSERKNRNHARKEITNDEHTARHHSFKKN